MTMRTIHLVSHTHWDREWYLTFQQFRLKLVHLVDRLLDILHSNLEFKYFLLDGQAIILEDYLQIRPERESEIRQYVENGRLTIGPWYISPDEFLVSPESHVRNLLEGDRICRQFGPKMQIGYLPDTFGHIGQMPQILSQFGLNGTCLFRGLDDQPVELFWQSPDGSQVLVSFLRDSYSNAASLSTSDWGRFIREVNEMSQSLAAYSHTSHVLLMHGTDHMEPPANLPAAMQAYRERSPQAELVHSSLPGYFAAVRSELLAAGIALPVVPGELRSSKRSPLLPNVLSTRIPIKQRNHQCETDLIKWAEPMHAWSALLHSQLHLGDNHHADSQLFLMDQSPLIHQAWRLLMQCHPHDSICGTSIDQVAREMQVRFDQVDQITQELVSQDLQNISQQINTTFVGPGESSRQALSSIIVFNPNDQPQSGLINLLSKLDSGLPSFELIDDQNNSIPFHRKGMGMSELISMNLDKQGMKQGMSMVHEGYVAGLILRDFRIDIHGSNAVIHATLSDHGQVDPAKWSQWLAEFDQALADPAIDEYIVHAYPDAEVDLTFVAQDVPGHGVRSYWLVADARSEAAAPQPKKLSPLLRRFLPVVNLISRIPLARLYLRVKKSRASIRPAKIENEFFIVYANNADGSITVTDKRNHQVYPGLNRFVDGGDCGDVYNYSPPQHDQLVFSHRLGIEQEITPSFQKLTIRTGMSIPYSLSADRKSRLGKTKKHTITSTITLVPGIPRIDVRSEIDNESLNHRLRVHFPAPFSCSSAFFDGHYELVERPLNLPSYDQTWVEPPRPEVPQRQFTLVTQDNLSLTIANRGLPEVEVLINEDGNAEMAVTLLRCVGWLSRDDFSTRKGHAGPMGIATPGAQMLGRHSFEYSIIPGDQIKSLYIHQAYAFNAPLKAITAPVHAGSFPSTFSFIQNSNPNFIITAIKQSEAGSQLVVRGYNISSAPLTIDLTLFRSFRQVQLLNLAEQPTRVLQTQPNGRVSLQVDGCKIITLGFQD